MFDINKKNLYKYQVFIQNKCTRLLVEQYFLELYSNICNLVKSNNNFEYDVQYIGIIEKWYW